MPRKWHHIAIAHVYSRWGRSDIHCYIDGHLAETIDMSWLVSTNEVCYTADYEYISFGCTHSSISTNATLGVHRMAMQKVAFVVRWAHCMCSPRRSVYSKPTRYIVSDQDIRVIFGTMPNAIYPMDTKRYLDDIYMCMTFCQHLFDGRLSNTLMMAYCPKNCDRQLCLESSPKGNVNYFLQIPHAVMKEVWFPNTLICKFTYFQGVTVITTYSIHSSLHSVGGIQMLLPLFAQLDMPHASDENVDSPRTIDYNIWLDVTKIQ
jgi:hypothetical protein